jgi:hypothetical protein
MANAASLRAWPLARQRTDSGLTGCQRTLAASDYSTLHIRLSIYVFGQAQEIGGTNLIVRVREFQLWKTVFGLQPGAPQHYAIVGIVTIPPGTDRQ